jgi:hypothetical protein
MSGTVSTGDLARLVSGIGAWITGSVAASPTPTTTQFAVTGYDFTAAPSLAGALVIVGQATRRVGQVASNSGATLTLSTALASAPAVGDPVLIFPEVSVNFSGAENIAEVGGQAVPAVGGVPSVPVKVEGTAAVNATVAGSLTDASGTTSATANTSTQALAAGLVTRYLFIQNVSTTSGDNLWVNFGAAATAGPGAILLSPGASLSYEGSFVPNGSINVLSNVASLPYTLKYA